MEGSFITPDAGWSISTVMKIWRLCGEAMRFPLALWLCVAVSCPCARAQDNPLNIISALNSFRPAKSVVRAIKLAAPEYFTNLETRLANWGYPFEVHTVRTEDGYLLTVHRIPSGRNITGNSNNLDDIKARVGHPVLMTHGMFGCSESLLIAGPEIAPALRLADSGYDVWMMNVRGTHYSNKHESMNRWDRRFWMYSMHEMGVYDIPAVIDYVVNNTKQEKLFHVGHSMGTTVFYIAMSMRPEYNVNIRLHIALAPPVFFDGIKSTLIEVAIDNINYLKVLRDTWPTYELFRKNDFNIASTYLLCDNKAFISKACALAACWIGGPMDLNHTTQISLQLARASSSTSTFVASHYAELITSGEFKQIDYGRELNPLKNNKSNVRKYPLEKVTAPIAIYIAKKDLLVPVQGTERLRKELPNVVSYKVINEKLFNHFDFIIHPRLNELLINHVLETMRKY